MGNVKSIAFCLILLFLGVNAGNLHGQNKSQIQPYRIERIKKKNNWYFIYASRNDSLFKIVSKKPADKDKYTLYNKIRRHKRYDLVLEAYSDHAPIINGVKAAIPGYTGGFCLDRCTTVMLEPRNGIWDLYYSPNLKGIHYLPPKSNAQYLLPRPPNSLIFGRIALKPLQTATCIVKIHTFVERLSQGTCR